MKGWMSLAALLLAGCDGGAHDPLTAKQAIALPEAEPALPPGPHVELVARDCLGCHSADMILNQPRLDAKHWNGVIDKMVEVYKAPIAEADRPALVAYLDATNAKLAK